ncbi:MAG: DUF4837 family protein [bacterium]|nr:DUF4837 family protein [Candidatus Limimorpha caballi]MCQ2315643.1 DUF4837 family protein [Bacteroidales bacterium]
MRKINSIMLTVMVIGLLTSCTEKTVKQSKDRSVGGSSEILFVTQNEEQWNGVIGEAVRGFFEAEQYGLPQPEKTFKVVNISAGALNDMFKKHRNLIIAEINPELPNPIIESEKDWMSAPQYAIKIKANDAETWVSVFNSQKEKIRKQFDKNERERLLAFYRPNANTEAINAIKNKFGFTITVPKDFCIAVDRDRYMSITKDAETKELIMNLIIYELPYKTESDLSESKLIKVRDSVVRKYIAGPTDGSYMVTDLEFVKPAFKTLPDFPAGYAIEMRGMWNMAGEFMAGPFISYTIVNPTRNKLTTIEGFVYYPNKEKRDYLRQLESIIYSLKFNQGTTSL